MTSLIDVANRSLSEGQTRSLINAFPPIENSPAAVVAGLQTVPKIQMVLRGANWEFARRQIQLTLLKAAVINGQISSNPPPQPFQYSYAYPADCLRGRFLIQFQQPSPAGTPFTTGPQNIINPAYAVTRVPFVVANDPDATTQVPRKVILTNMANAMLVYTSDLSQFPDMWDPMFSAAVSATLAAYFIAALAGDKALMAQQIQLAKGVLDSARGMNASESITNQDHVPDWLSIRASGGGYGGWSYGSGQATYNGYGGGWDACSFPDGLTY